MFWTYMYVYFNISSYVPFKQDICLISTGFIFSVDYKQQGKMFLSE